MSRVDGFLVGVKVMNNSVWVIVRKIGVCAILSFGVVLSAQAAVQAPNQFIGQIANNILDAIKKDSAAREGDVAAVNKIVDQVLMPSINFEKTTRLATGLPWRSATDSQKKALVNAFKKTLVRTYSGAFKNVNDDTRITLKPFRGDINAKIVTVRSIITLSTGSVAVDYRLEKSANRWKVFDFSVENVWLVQNYKNQFAAEINKGGIDGLIHSLEK